MPSNLMQSRRGFFRAFAVVAGGAAVAAVVGGGSKSATPATRTGSASTAAAAPHYAQRVAPRPSLAVTEETGESPVAHAQRNNVRPAAIPSFRL